MSFKTNNNGPTEKNTWCKYGCQTAIKFDKNQVSARGVKIPLNLDGTPHDCPRSPFNKAKHGQEIDINTIRTITCKYCGQQITFNNKITSARGRKIPLNGDGSNHNCRNNFFNQVDRRNNDKKYEIKGRDFSN
jgi:hypothetical protein